MAFSVRKWIPAGPISALLCARTRWTHVAGRSERRGRIWPRIFCAVFGWFNRPKTGISWVFWCFLADLTWFQQQKLGLNGILSWFKAKLVQMSWWTKVYENHNYHPGKPTLERSQQETGGFFPSTNGGWNNRFFLSLNGSKFSWLVVWNMVFMTFHLLGRIIPTDFHIFQRVETTNQDPSWVFLRSNLGLSQNLDGLKPQCSFSNFLFFGGIRHTSFSDTSISVGSGSLHGLISPLRGLSAKSHWISNT